MKRTRATWLLALAGMWGCWTLAGDTPGLAQGGDLVMVVNKANSASVGKAEAKKILLGQMTSWPSGSKVVVALRAAGSPDRAAVLKKICAMTESDYTRYGLQVAFTGGTAATVRDAPSDAAIAGFVKANPGAVGFLHKAAAGDDVKVALTVE